jgi:hypothetical protein
VRSSNKDAAPNSGSGSFGWSGCVFGAFLTGNQQWIEKYGQSQLLQNQQSAFRIAEKCLDGSDVSRNTIGQHFGATVSHFEPNGFRRCAK